MSDKYFEFKHPYVITYRTLHIIQLQNVNYYSYRVKHLCIHFFYSNYNVTGDRDVTHVKRSVNFTSVTFITSKFIVFVSFFLALIFASGRPIVNTTVQSNLMQSLEQLKFYYFVYESSIPLSCP